MTAINDAATPSPGPQPHPRPLSITIICVIGFIGALFAIPMVFSDAIRGVASWYPAYLGISSLIGLVCFVGLWRMKKMAAYGYAAFVACNQVILLASGLWTLPSLLIPAVVAAVALMNVRKMT